MEHLANSKGIGQTSEDTQTTVQQDREKQQIELTQSVAKATTTNKTTGHSSAPIPQVMVEEVDQHKVEVSQNIFRAYDIRGTVNTDLTAEVAEQLGLSLGSELQIRGEDKIILAWDGRLSSPELANALQQGLLNSGCNVINIGSVTTGSLYYACHELDTHNGIIVTGSHNGADINGFKIVIDRQTLSKEQLMALYHRIQRHDYRSGQGQLTEQNINEAYLDRIQGDIQLLSLIHI